MIVFPCSWYTDPLRIHVVCIICARDQAVVSAGDQALSPRRMEGTGKTRNGKRGNGKQETGNKKWETGNEKSETKIAVAKSTAGRCMHQSMP